VFKLGLLVVLLFSCSVAIGGESRCFEKVNVDINQLHPPIRIAGGVERRSKILINQQVDCVTKKIIKPKSLIDALNMLDFALPLDYKTAIVSSNSVSAYRHSDYGVSVDEDLFDYFHDAWLLDQKDNICYKKFGSKYKPEEEGCFWLLMEKLIIIHDKGMIDTEWTVNTKK